LNGAGIHINNFIFFLDEKGVTFLKIFQKFSNKFKNDVFDIFNPQQSVASKITFGSTNPKMVKAQIARWKAQLKKEINQLKRASRQHA